MRFRLKTGACLLFFVLSGAAGGQGLAPTAPTRSVILYSGRAKAGVEPLLLRFEAQTGVHVNAVYDSDAALVSRIADEQARGVRGADLFWANSLQTLNTVQGRFQPLPASLSAGVLPAYQPQSGRWLPTDARYRALAYSSDRLKAADLPASIWALPSASFLKGRLGWTVADPTFTELVAGLIADRGEDAARAWLVGVMALAPRDFGGENRGMLDAINAGSLDAALTTHVTVQRVRRAGHHVETALFGPGDAGNLLDESGVGLLANAPHRADALRLARALVQPEAQAFLLSVNFEYPVILALPYPATLWPAADLRARASTLSPDAVGQNLERARRLLTDLDLL